MSETLLSICIPTFNFGNFIGETLSSIIGQIESGVEIIILDGGSIDQTAEVVGAAQRLSLAIHYHRLDQKGGIDRDMARVVSLAQGRYCWLFSGDDLMRPGAIRRVLESIRSGADVYLCKHSMCTLDMRIIGDRAVLDSAIPLTSNLGDDREKTRYFELAQTTEAFFSFIGGVIVRKERWDSVPLNERFVGTCWAHVARLFELMPQGLTVVYLPEVLCDRRGDNDSFADRGVVKRYAIAIDGYHSIADAFLGSESVHAYHVRRVVRNEFGLRMFLYARLCCWRNPRVEDRVLLNCLIGKAYRDAPVKKYWMLAICNLMPGWVYHHVRASFQGLKRVRSAA